MSLTVDVLPLSPLPVVRLRVDVPAAWSVTGRAGGESWKVAEGAGLRWLSDPWAPVNMPVTYTLTSGTSSETSEPVVRAFAGRAALTDLHGRRVVDFLWMKEGGAPVTQEPRHGFYDAPGSRLPSYLSAAVAGAGGGSLTARTVRGSTRALRALIEANDPVVLHHNEGRCKVGDCDIPPVRTVILTDAPEDRTSRLDVAERSWPLPYRLVRNPWGYIPPVATVADYIAMWPLVGDVQASGLTVGEIQSGGWLVDL